MPLPDKNISFQVIDWSQLALHHSAGERGEVSWRGLNYPGLRIRIVEYSRGYIADHWCRKGHIVYCLSGSFTSELITGETFYISEGMSYIVSDDLSQHRSATNEGVRLLIIDGDFLRLK